MNREHFPDPSVSRFLDEVTEQISYEPLRPSIRQELESHIQERIEDYKADGLTSGEAEDKALRGMGDAVAIGTVSYTHLVRVLSDEPGICGIRSPERHPRGADQARHL